MRAESGELRARSSERRAETGTQTRRRGPTGLERGEVVGLGRGLGLRAEAGAVIAAGPVPHRGGGGRGGRRGALGARGVRALGVGLVSAVDRHTHTHTYTPRAQSTTKLAAGENELKHSTRLSDMDAEDTGYL